MFKIVLIASLLVSAVLAAPVNEEYDPDRAEIERQQNQEAQYDFNAKIDDRINDGQLHREEHRENGKVVGSYSYNDGYVQRTVHYEADENGYRVTKEEMQNIGNGPVFNPEGQADVQGTLIGQYSIKLDPTDDKQHYKGTQEN